MQINIDGVVIKSPLLKKDPAKNLVVRPRVFIIAPNISVVIIPEKKITKRSRLRNIHPAWMAMSLLMTLSFIGGMITVWQTQLSVAETDSASNTSSGGLVKLMQQRDEDLTVVAELLPLLIKEYRYEPTPAERVNIQRKNKLRDYLALKRSPLAEDDAALDAFLSSNNMEMMLAISFVEGNFCRHQVEFNCSGIGGSKMHKYKNFAEWVREFDSLLERRYKGLKVEQFIGNYVVPGTDNWKNGVYQVLGELQERGIK